MHIAGADLMGKKGILEARVGEAGVGNPHLLNNENLL